MPQGNTLTSVHGTAPDDVWAVGDLGTVLWFGGEAWTLTPSGTTAPLRAVWAAQRDDAWMGGDDGTLLHWDGSKLVPTKATKQNIVAISGSGASDVWAIANTSDHSGKASFLHWDGKAWTTTPTDYSNLEALWVRSPNDAWAAGNPDDVLGSYVILHFDGSEWKHVDGPSDGDFEPMGFRFGGDDNTTWMLAGGFNFSTVYTFDGAEWKQQYQRNESKQLDAIWVHDGEAWTVGDATVIHSEGGGEAHELKNVVRPTAVWGTAADDVWQVGWTGGIAHFDGQHWTTPGGPKLEAGRVVMGSGPNDLWNIGVRVHHYDGKSWSETQMPHQEQLWNSIWVAGESNAWILSDGGTVAHWNGQAWSALPQRASLRNDTGRIWAAAEDDVWVQDIENDLPQHWDGSKWRTIGLDGCGNGGGRAIWASSPTDVWVASPRGMLHVTGTDMPLNDTYAKRACALDSTVTDASAIWGRSDQDIWAAGLAGAVYHYDGNSWTRLDHGTTTATLASIWAAGADDVWAAGTDPLKPTNSVIIHWDGNAWTSMSGMGSLSSLWGADSANVWAVGATASILRYVP